MMGLSLRTPACTWLRGTCSLLTMSALTVVLVAASAGTASAQPGALDDSFGSAGTVVESASNGASGVALVPAGVADAGSSGLPLTVT